MQYPKITFLLNVLDEAYGRKAWHGPTLRGSLRGVSAAQAAWRPAPGRHNIWEIVLHTAYWKYAVCGRLTGGKRGLFPYKGSNWFAHAGTPDTKAWRNVVAFLEQQHQLLRAAVAAFSPRQLHQTGLAHKTTPAQNILGIALHDVYHAGQIQLLKRLQHRGRNT